MITRTCTSLGAILCLLVACDDGGGDSGGSTGGGSTGGSGSPTTESPTTDTPTTESPTTSTSSGEGTSSSGGGTTSGSDGTTGSSTGGDESSGSGSSGSTGGEVQPGPESIYIVDAGNNRLVRVDDLTGSGWETYSEGLTEPVDVAVDGQGRIYITDRGSEELAIPPSIIVLDSFDDGTPEVFTGGSYAFGGPDEPEAMLDLQSPTSIEVGPDGAIYFTDVFRVVQLDAIPPTYWRTRGSYGSGGINGNDTDEFFALSDLYVDETGLYVSDATRNHIACMGAFDSSEWMLAGFEQPGVDLNGPWGFVRSPDGSKAACSDGTFILVDRYNERIMQAELSFGAYPEDNAPGSVAGAFSNVQTYDVGAMEDLADVAIAPNGEFFVTEQNLASILGMEDITGTGFVSYGDQGAGVDQFDFPWGIAVAPRPWAAG